MMNIGVESNEIESILGVLKNYEKIEKVLLYGSRAMGNFKPFSDIDLAIIGNEIDLFYLQSLENELDDLLLVYKFDISIYDSITNPAFKEHIDRVGIVFYQK